MNIKMNDFLEAIKDADMVLIGLGEEFNQLKVLKENPEYTGVRAQLEGTDKEWLIPALNMVYGKENTDVFRVLTKFAEIIAEKNYFVVSVSTNETIREVAWREKRLVMPCGGSWMKQCAGNCGQELSEVTEEDKKLMQHYFEKAAMEPLNECGELSLGTCPKCGESLVLNSIYTEKYDENGYLDQWQLYTKWLQGTLNRKLVVVELGVGMQCPSVIRFPFEKVAFFNQKASFWRINENLYQLSEELNGKGTSISMNAIDWLGLLC